MIFALKKLVYPLAILSASTLYAAGSSDYKFITIPGAKCGDGSPYQIVHRKGKQDKVAFAFKGGGACWDHNTCKTKVFTKLFVNSKMMENVQGYMSSDPQYSPVHDHDLIVFPYCTGDIFAGHHEMNYKNQLHVNHHGRTNVEKSLAYIKENKIVNTDGAQELSVYGESAGALGAIFNMDLLADLGNFNTKKIVVLDSPGLHWGDSVWDRFTSEYIGNILESSDRVGLGVSMDKGTVAKGLVPFCQNYPDWKMAYIQGTRDVVMSIAFGGILPAQHHLKVLSKNGINQILKDDSDNCSSWVDVSMEHVFLEKTKNYTKKTKSKKTLKEYLFERFAADLNDPAPSYR
jgi:hypothetical protein